MRDKLRVIGKDGLQFFKLFGQSILSFILAVFFSKWFLKKVPSKPFQNCIILGNGPSLDSQLEQIRSMRSGSSLLCLNDLPFSLLFNELKPEFYTLVDPYYWFLIEGNIPERTDRLLTAISQKVEWPITLILPYEMGKIIRTNQGIRNNKYISISYFNRFPISGFRFIRFKMFDLNLGMPTPQNVLVAAIYLMLTASYKKIFIFGADHSWHENILVTNDNILRVREPHFKFEKDKNSISDREEFFDPVYKFSYDKDGEREIFKMHEIFAAWSRAFEAYWVLRDYATYLNAKVINLSSKSFIDAFDRENSNQ